MMEDTATLGDATGQDLVEFFDYLVEKSLMNKNTAGSMRAACTQMLAIESEDFASIKLQDLDVDTLGRRFENRRGKEFKPASLTAYQLRFRKGLSMYTEWLKDPKTWKAPMREHTSSGNGASAKGASGSAAAPKPPALSSGLTAYPFPLRDGVMAQLHLPVDLRKAEVKRLSAFLESLAMDEQRALPPASDPEQTES